MHRKLVTKGAIYDFINATGKKIVKSIPDGIPAEHYSGAWYIVPVSDSADALVTLNMLETVDSEYLPNPAPVEYWRGVE